MAKALLLVDLSKDFINLDGALNCGPAGVAILPYCQELVGSFLKDGALVIDARDLHDETDYEIATGLFPPHNLQDTPGQDLVDELSNLLREKPENWVYVPKKTYNAMYQTNLAQILVDRQIDELHVIGVCTDICVRYTVNGLHEWRMQSGYPLSITVHQQGVASFNPEGHRESLGHFGQAFGVTVV